MPENRPRLPVTPVQFAAQLLHIQNPGERLSPEAINRAWTTFSAELERDLASPIQLYGHRVQAMFAAMVTSIGSVQLLQNLDIGDHWSSVPVQPADYLIVTSEGKLLAVEVKNNHQVWLPTERLEFRSKDIEQLNSHAELIGAELMVAVYLSRIGLWLLISASSLETHDSRKSITIERAMKTNCMNLVGDRVIATRAPLVFRLTVQSEQVPEFIDGRASIELLIENAEIFCAGKRIEDKTEQSIAMKLMMLGSWEEEETTTFDEDGRPQLYEITASPPDPFDQPFHMVGSWSGMFSRVYMLGTTEEESNSVTQIYTSAVPTHIGAMITEPYEGKALPLWRFEWRPNLNS